MLLLLLTFSLPSIGRAPHRLEVGVKSYHTNRHSPSPFCLLWTVKTLSVVYSAISFDSNALSISFCRMASGCVKIWVKVEDGKPRGTTGVRVKSNADINDLIATALETLKVGIAKDLVTVMFEGEKIRID